MQGEEIEVKRGVKYTTLEQLRKVKWKYVTVLFECRLKFLRLKL